MRSVKIAGLVAAVFSAVTALGAAPTSENAKMRAIVIRAYGGPEVLKLEEVVRPEPADDEVLIRVVAASINPVDVAIRKGYVAKLLGGFPLILGMDAAGMVEKVGNKVTNCKAGDPVFAFFTLKRQGGYAEFVTAKQEEFALKPSTVSFAQAAGVGAAGSTAWEALVDTASLRAGQTVLIHGGSGGVGHFAIQIAKARGRKFLPQHRPATRSSCSKWEQTSRSIIPAQSSKTSQRMWTSCSIRSVEIRSNVRTG